MENIDLDKLVNRHNPRPKALENSWFAPQNPFFWLIVAPTGGGKTYSLIQLILQGHLKFDHLYLYMKDVEEDKWQFVLQFLKTIEENAEAKVKLFTVGTHGSEIPNPDDLPVEGTKLFIFDDFITDNEANKTVIRDLFTRGRKKNCSVVYISQSYFSLEKDIRLQCNYFSFFKMPSKREMMEFAKDHATDIEFHEFQNLYKQAINKPFGFLFIDRKTNDPCLRYRSGLTGLLKPSEKNIE